MEIEELRQKITNEYKAHAKLPKELIDLKKRVQLFVKLKQYDEGEELQN
jgi:hypothetical protein